MECEIQLQKDLIRYFKFKYRLTNTQAIEASEEILDLGAFDSAAHNSQATFVC